MVSDWMQKLEADGHYRRCRIKAIIDDTVDCETSDGEVHTLSVSGIESIPLTSKILELNGWQYGDWGNEDYTDEYYTIDDDYFDIHIDVTGNFEIRTIDGQTIKIKYVHELQHALKLCGIDKNIEL